MSDLRTMMSNIFSVFIPTNKKDSLPAKMDNMSEELDVQALWDSIPNRDAEETYLNDKRITQQDENSLPHFFSESTKKDLKPGIYIPFTDILQGPTESIFHIYSTGEDGKLQDRGNIDKNGNPVAKVNSFATLPGISDSVNEEEVWEELSLENESLINDETAEQPKNTGLWAACATLAMGLFGVFEGLVARLFATL